MYTFSIENWILGKKIIGKYVLLFSTDFLLLMFHNNTLKISENLKKWNLLKKPT